MKIVVINGTPVKGVTYFMKEEFLKTLRDGNEVKEYYPKDMPPFCMGCKQCFLKGEDKCPHYNVMNEIWSDLMKADLLVFAYPVYALRVPASIKSLLDHMCVHWMVHRPEPDIFKKSAVIITNSAGAPNGAAQKDVKTSLNWMGLSKVYTSGIGMMGDVLINKINLKHKEKIEKKMKALADKVKNIKPRKHMSLKVRLFFEAARVEHKMVLKAEETVSLDVQHYLNYGWIKR